MRLMGWIQDNKLAEGLAKFIHNYPFKSTERFMNLLQQFDSVDMFVIAQKKEFEMGKNELYDYIHHMFTSGKTEHVHLIFQSRSVMIKYYLDAYRLVN